jgi:hypothetical protein
MERNLEDKSREPILYDDPTTELKELEIQEDDMAKYYINAFYIISIASALTYGAFQVAPLIKEYFVK